MPKIFHIRAKLPRKGGNSFYKARESRVPKTLCGAPVTDHDVRFSWDWRAMEIYDYICCQECIAVKESTAKKSPCPTP